MRGLRASELRTVRRRSDPSTAIGGRVEDDDRDGADTHEQSHTLAAVVAASGRMLAERLGAEYQHIKSGVFRARSVRCTEQQPGTPRLEVGFLWSKAAVAAAEVEILPTLGRWRCGRPASMGSSAR